jgi:hypothetical protein
MNLCISRARGIQVGDFSFLERRMRESVCQVKTKIEKCEEESCANENASRTKIPNLIPELRPKLRQKIMPKNNWRPEHKTDRAAQELRQTKRLRPLVCRSKNVLPPEALLNTSQASSHE